MISAQPLFSWQIAGLYHVSGAMNRTGPISWDGSCGVFAVGLVRLLKTSANARGHQVILIF